MLKKIIPAILFSGALMFATTVNAQNKKGEVCYGYVIVHQKDKAELLSRITEFHCENPNKEVLAQFSDEKISEAENFEVIRLKSLEKAKKNRNRLMHKYQESDMKFEEVKR